MKKFQYSWLAKLIAVIILLCSLTAFTAFAAFGILNNSLQQNSSLYNDVMHKIGENYACAVISTLESNNPDSTDEVDRILENTQFTCAVIQTETQDLSEIDLSDEDIYVYGSPRMAYSYTDSYWGYTTVRYNYTLDSFLGALTVSHYMDYKASGTPISNDYYIVLAKVLPDATYNDLYFEADQAFELLDQYADMAVPLCCIFIVLAIGSGVYLVGSAGHRPDSYKIKLTFLDRIPLEVYTIILILLGILCGSGFMLLGLLTDYRDAVWLGCLIAAGLYGLALLFVSTIVVRIKAKCFWRYTLLHYIASPFKKFHARYRENTPLFKRMLTIAIVVFILVLLTGLLAVSMSRYSVVPFVIWLFILAGIAGYYFYHIVVQLNELKNGGERIAEGKIDQAINTDNLTGEFKQHAENLNSIRQSIELAVNEKMKSERFKTELITNVSHDIKTPLTSIINYVDLMKKEDITDPVLQEYMEVLDRQSSRLKKLIEDLIEASKASTGNLAVNYEECDVNVMLSQVIGEFEDKMLQRGLTPVVTYPENSALIMADGRHLWRIFDNLLNNICKYAQTDTRVYVDVDKTESSLNIIFKNISSTPLNISSEELMERFVRGDSSRNTEGSGLGLSIARNLTELMQGKLDLIIDGDLFKVILTFPLK